jgi:hypothetical protein
MGCGLEHAGNLGKPSPPNKTRYEKSNIFYHNRNHNAYVYTEH